MHLIQNVSVCVCVCAFKFLSNFNKILFFSSFSLASLKLKETDVPILSDYQCLRKTNLLTDKNFIIPTSSFCAGGDPNNDACQFDGGGPLVCSDEDNYYELTGLVSYGFGCDRDQVSNVFGMVKISLFINWINQIISVNN